MDDLLDEIASSFEDVWRERADLADKVEQLEADLVRFRELETLLRTTLMSAERAAVGLKEQAAKEADLIVEEARSEARAITRPHARITTACSPRCAGCARSCTPRSRSSTRLLRRRSPRPRRPRCQARLST